jgi:hypothetical protein
MSFRNCGVAMRGLECVRAAALGLGVAVTFAVPASATVVFETSGTAAGVGVAAQASFTVSGDFLTITLGNTSAAHAATVHDVPGSTLTGVLFHLTGDPTLLPVSALIAAGSLVQGDKCNAGACTTATVDVGGEWGYEDGGFAGGANQAIASAGYLTTGLRGNIGNFNDGEAGIDLDSPKGIGGINFGIVSAADGYNPNGGLAKVPLIQGEATFILEGVLGLTEADISDVSFQYGTSWNEANLPAAACMACGMSRDNDDVGSRANSAAAPEPAMLAIFAVASIALVSVRRRRAFATRA